MVVRILKILKISSLTLHKINFKMLYEGNLGNRKCQKG